MLDRAEPLTARGLDVFREISQEALQAGVRLQKLRQLFDSAPLQQIRCGMGALLAEVLPVLSSVALDVRAQLQVGMSEELPEVLVEPLRIQRVLLALVRNAAAASCALSTDRVIRIDVAGERYCVETSITDWGGGVSAEIQPQLFHPFFTTRPSGHGLGLSSSRAIVESHGGSMGFNNVSNGGVRFWFKLPMAPG